MTDYDRDRIEREELDEAYRVWLAHDQKLDWIIIVLSAIVTVALLWGFWLVATGLVSAVLR